MTPSAAPDRVPVGELVRGMRLTMRNWWFIGPLGWLVMPSRLPPRRGLLNRPIARRVVTARLRDGSALRCRINELFAVAEVFALRTYDRPGIDWRSLRTILDIGANVGAATLWMAQRAPQARIVAVEPSPPALRLLRENVARNHLEDRVTIVAGAVGRADGATHIGVDELSVSGRTSDDGGGAEVRVYALDTLLSDAALASVDLIKIDCEGAEYDAFAGASTALLSGLLGVVGEYHAVSGHTPGELVDLLQPAGFEVSIQGNPEIGSFTAWRATTRGPDVPEDAALLGV